MSLKPQGHPFPSPVSVPIDGMAIASRLNPVMRVGGHLWEDRSGGKVA